MGIILLDADVIIRGEMGLFDLNGWVASRTGDQMEVAAVTVAELWHGIEQASGARKAKRQDYIQAVLERLPIIPYTEQTAYKHARIWSELRASGNMISYYDIIIAATAIERGGEVASFNYRHFSKVKGLGVIEPK